MKKVFAVTMLLALSAAAQFPFGRGVGIRGPVDIGSPTIWKSASEIGSTSGLTTDTNGNLVVESLIVTSNATFPSPMLVTDVVAETIEATASIKLNGTNVVTETELSAEEAARISEDATKVDNNNGTATNLTVVGNRTIQLAPTSIATNNGSLLLAAYAQAQGMSPAVSNEVSIILPPAIYDLGASTLNMTSEYINVIGQVPVTLTMIGKVDLGGGIVGTSAVLTGEEPETIITSSGVAISNKVNNGSVRFIKVVGDVVTDGAKAAVWQDVWFTGNVDKELPTSNTFIRVYAPLGICGDPEYSGDGSNHFYGRAEQSIISGYFCVGGGGTASGTFSDCTISGYSCVGGEGGTASGTFSDCTISGYFCVGGGGTASGTFSDCTISGEGCVGGSSGTASGTFSDCTISGDFCVGGEGGTASGTFSDCTISGDFCVGGGYGTVSGIDVFQCKITGPNQMSYATFSTNSLFSFSTGVPLAITNSVAKVFNCATETLVPVPNQ